MVQGKTKEKVEPAANSSQVSLSEKTPRSLKRKARNWKRTKQKKLKSKNVEGASQSQIAIGDKSRRTTASAGKAGNLKLNENGKEKGSNLKISENGKKKGKKLNLSKHGKEKESNSKVSENGMEKESNLNISENGKEKESNLIKSENGKESNEKERNVKTMKNGKEKSFVNTKKKIKDKQLEQKKVAPSSERKLGGLIFMCNGKTKPDCFRYKVMALPSGKKEAVLGIKPGLKLFLYDFDLKLLYGIFEASSAGGMKLEPAAFSGAFPAQVRFRIHEDCLPLAESVFKKAIKENYDERTNKFKTELTSKQVKKLRSLFRLVRQPHVKDHPAVLQPSSSSDPLFVTEEEYRSYGLRPVRHSLRQDGVPYVPVPESYGTSQGREQVFRSPAPIYKDTSTQEQNLRNPVPAYTNVSSMQEAPVSGPFSTLRDQAANREPLYLSESDYRKYGLRGRSEHPSMTLSITRPINDFDSHRENQYQSHNHNALSYPYSSSPVGATTMISTASRPINDFDSYRESQYHSHNYIVSSSDPYSRSAVGTMTYESYPQSTVTEAYRGDLHSARGSYATDYHLPRSIANEGLYPTYASRDLSEYNQRSHTGDQSELGPAPVSSRYAFAGASYSLR